MKSRGGYLVVGHVTRDVTPEGWFIGGTAAYAAAMARNLGYETRLVTAGTDDVALPDTEIFRLASEHTTTFEYEWVAGERIQRMTSRAERITAAAVPEQWRDSAIWHLGPVADEIDPDLLKIIPQASFVGVTPQGWLRTVGAGGIVMPKPWKSWKRLSRRANAIVVSQDDLPHAHEQAARWSRCGPAVAVTAGENGATLFVDGESVTVESFPADLVDELGAGDTFAVALFSCLHDGCTPREAGVFAAAAASLSVKRSGSDSAPSVEEIANLLGERTPGLTPSGLG